MPMPLAPPSIGTGSPSAGIPAASSGMMANQQPQPSYGGTDALLYQPTGQQMSDPATMLATVFRKILDLVEATNQSFPGGEDKISQGMQLIGLGLNEKVQRMGMQEPPGPPTAG